MSLTVAQLLKMPAKDFLDSEYGEAFARKFAKEASDMVARRFGLKADSQFGNAAAAMNIIGVRERRFRELCNEYPELQPDGKGSHRYDLHVAMRIKEESEKSRPRKRRKARK